MDSYSLYFCNPNDEISCFCSLCCDNKKMMAFVRCTDTVDEVIWRDGEPLFDGALKYAVKQRLTILPERLHVKQALNMVLIFSYRFIDLFTKQISFNHLCQRWISALKRDCYIHTCKTQ